MAVDARHDRADRRQIDVVVGVNVRQVGRAKSVGAVRAGRERGRDHPVWVLGQRARHTRMPAAAPLPAAGRQIGLLAFRRWHAGIVGCLGRALQPGFECGDTRGQRYDLLRLRLDPRMLRQNQGNKGIARERGKGCAFHASR
jgi:hypothetical protein